MLLILFSWIIITFIFLSFGNIAISFWNKLLKRNDHFSFFDIFWLGLSLVCIFLLITSLIFPINIYVNFSLFVTSIVFWIFNLKKGKALIREIFRKILRLPLYVKLSITTVIIIIIISGVNNVMTYDSGLYYLQTMMWNEQYSVVPGLGNLHSRFGFNSVFLLLSTLFYHPAYFSPFFPINGLCVFMVISWIIIQLSKTNDLFRQAAMFIVICIIFRFYYSAISSLMTDILPNFISIYLILSCALYTHNIRVRGLVLFILSLLCITLKLSFLVLIIIPLILTILYLKEKHYKHVWILLSFGALMIIPWVIRFVILTGYLVYPFPSLDIFSFDWKMTKELVELEKTIVYTWSIAPMIPLDVAINIPFKEWIFSWVSSRRILEMIIYILAALSPVIILFSFKKCKENRLITILWCISFFGALLNFILGPQPRFSFGLVGLSAIMPFFYYKIYIKKLSSIFCLALSFFFIYQLPTVVPWQNINSLLSFTFYSPVKLSDKINESNITFYEYTLDATIIYSTNPIGENPRICYEVCNNRCFDQDLPCTPYLNEGLRMRGNSLQDGFMIMRDN